MLPQKKESGSLAATKKNAHNDRSLWADNIEKLFILYLYSKLAPCSTKSSSSINSEIPTGTVTSLSTDS